MTEEIPFLTELQLSLMRVLWDRGRMTVVELTGVLRPDRPLAPTTVATVLSRLEKRGIVGHETQARQFVYYPKVTQPDAERSMVTELTDRLFGGDPAALVSHLLTDQQFSKGDLARVKALLARHEAKEKNR